MKRIVLTLATGERITLPRDFVFSLAMRPPGLSMGIGAARYIATSDLARVELLDDEPLEEPPCPA